MSWNAIAPRSVLAITLLGCCAPQGSADEPRLTDLSPEVRQRLDRAASRAPFDPVNLTAVDYAGNAVAWTISRLPMTDAEEADHARTAHQELTRKHRLVATPDGARAIFQQLVQELPERFRPAEFHYNLFTIDDPHATVFTLGAGRVYVTTGLLDQLSADQKRGPHALAWTLAHELGHIARRHCRRGYQWQELEDDVQRRLDRAALRRMRDWVQTSVAEAGRLTRFSYSRDQDYRADLFGLHLCRNAGFDLDAALDVLRLQVLAERPELLAADNGPLPQRRIPGAWEYYLSLHPDPLLRLKRLRMELAGEFANPEPFGLLLCDRATGQFAKADDGAVSQDRHAVIFVHGIESTHENFREAVTHLAEADCDCVILGYRWPDDESLARLGEHLTREVARVCRDPEQVSFVCHSAGGLVFRYYAEVKHGKFDQVVFLGTPQHGSELSPLRVLIEGGQFLGDVNLGLPQAVEQTSLDGQGQVAYDLRPGSLFLTYLNRRHPSRDRYTIIRGRAMGTTSALALDVAVTSGKTMLERLVQQRVRRPRVRALCLRTLTNARLPEEVSRGDLAVSLNSAALDGVDRIETVDLNHVQLKNDPAVLRRIVEVLHTAE